MTMHHGAEMSSRNIRRVGVPASKKGIPNPEYEQAMGPTLERLRQSGFNYHVGDDKRGNTVYTFCDSPLDRLYARLVKGAGKATSALDGIRLEYTALKKYRIHWARAGREMSIGSVDLNSTSSSEPSRRQGMPMAESHLHHSRIWRDARNVLGWKPHIVVENVVCAETSIEIAGWSIGYNSRTSARDGAEKILRESGRALAKFWRM